MDHWPHAPPHTCLESGVYMVTAATYGKHPHFAGPERLDLLQGRLLDLGRTGGWKVQAWAVFPNHYHFIAQSPEDPGSLQRWIQQLHSETGREVNRLDLTPGRRVWFQYWDTLLTYRRSYLARLNYVHRNAVKHGIVTEAAQYRWCSAAWFEARASPAFYRTVTGFRIDRLNVTDDF